MNRAVTNHIVTESRNFFWNLIDLTGTYFLSDYVEDIKDYVGEDEARVLCQTRDALKSLCAKYHLDFHGISCDVSREFLANQKGGMTTNEVCQQLFEAGDWIQGMLSADEVNQDHIQKMLFAIDEAVELIRTHASNDDQGDELPPPPQEITINL